MQSGATDDHAVEEHAIQLIAAARRVTRPLINELGPVVRAQGLVRDPWHEGPQVVEVFGDHLR